jgi:diacylglycerol kinase (ATP)
MSEEQPIIEDIIKFSIAGRFRSVKCALAGVFTMLRYEHNAWIHALATLCVSVLGYCVHLDRSEWCWIIIAILTVWAAEALNTAFEFLADVAVPDFHPTVEKAKDVAAGAVLIASIGSVIIGTLILGPHVRLMFATLLR